MVSWKLEIKVQKYSVGLNIKLPEEQKENKFVKHSLNFKYFFTRKVTFIKHSVAFIAMPGGFGTLDELSEALCLVQTKRMGAFPIVLFGKEFYKPLEKFFKVMLEYEYISKEDMSLYIITDDIDEAVEFIEKHSEINTAKLEKRKGVDVISFIRVCNVPYISRWKRRLFCFKTSK